MQRRFALGGIALATLLVMAAAAAAQCRGDADSNGFINFADYSAVRATFGTGCSEISYCGNGEVDVDEDCDFSALGGATCVSQGFAGGTLGCTPGCTFDTSGCHATRFTDNGDGTIADHESGLIWEKKVRRDSAVDPDNLQDADNTYPWAGVCSDAPSIRCQPDAASAAACTAHAQGNAASCLECGVGAGTCTVNTPGITVWQWISNLNATSFAGYDDWRLPRLRELRNLLSYVSPSQATFPAFHGASCGAACQDLANPACSCTSPHEYWTATTRHSNLIWAWNANFAHGAATTSNMSTAAHRVRAVRGGS